MELLLKEYGALSNSCFFFYPIPTILENQMFSYENMEYIENAKCRHILLNKLIYHFYKDRNRILIMIFPFLLNPQKIPLSQT